MSVGPAAIKILLVLRFIPFFSPPNCLCFLPLNISHYGVHQRKTSLFYNAVSCCMLRWCIRLEFDAIVMFSTFERIVDEVDFNLTEIKLKLSFVLTLVFLKILKTLRFAALCGAGRIGILC